MDTPLFSDHWCASVDATIQLRTGCNPLEKHGPQAVAVHVDAWAPLAAVANPHDIADVVDYEVIYLAIRRLEEDDHCTCLESSILRLMDAVFSIPMVSQAAISIKKPHVYHGRATPGIALTLSRDAWQRQARPAP